MRAPAVPVVVFALAAVGLAACNDTTTPDETNTEEVITTVALSFAPVSGGDAIVARWADPENDLSPVIDPITLADADDYALSVQFLNELEDPAEDLTLEVSAEGDEHQVFFTGTAVQGPAAPDNPDAVIGHAYADADENGLPVGLVNDVTTLGPGAGVLTVTLRHVPRENGAVKVDGLAADVASGGFAAIGGENDAQVDFDLTVQ